MHLHPRPWIYGMHGIMGCKGIRAVPVEQAVRALMGIQDRAWDRG